MVGSSSAAFDGSVCKYVFTRLYFYFNEMEAMRLSGVEDLLTDCESDHSMVI